MEELVGGGGGFGAHVTGVPFDLFAEAQGDVAEEDRFGELGGIIEVGHRRGTAFARGDPFFVVTG